LIEPSHEQDVHDQVDESQGQKFSPTDAHDLVITESRNRPTNPNEEEDQKRGFGEKPTYAEQGSNPGGRPRVGDPWEEMPTAEEYGGEDSRTHDDMSVLRYKKDSKFKASILGMETADQIGFGFRHVERQSIRLGKKGDEKD
jgi:hypothetical protein